VSDALVVSFIGKLRQMARDLNKLKQCKFYTMVYTYDIVHFPS